MVNEEMVTIASPDGAIAELDIASTGERFKARDGGMYDVPARVAPLIKELGGFMPNVGPMILKGPRCPGCGFASYFARCSRCGTDRRMAIAVTVDRLPEAQASAGARYFAIKHDVVRMGGGH